MIYKIKSILALFIIMFLTALFSISSAADKLRQNYGIVKVIGDFKPLETVNDLPKVVLDYISNESKYCLGISNPGDDFNSSCGDGTGSLPCKKMVYAANVNDIWFMEYLQGGAGVSQYFYAFKVKNGKIASVLAHQYTNGRRELSTRELENILSKRPECSKDNYIQYIAEVKLGFCIEG